MVIFVLVLVINRIKSASVVGLSDEQAVGCLLFGFPVEKIPKFHNNLDFYKIYTIFISVKTSKSLAKNNRSDDNMHIDILRF